MKINIVNPIDMNENKCLQYVATLPLYHKEIRKDSGRIAKIKPYIGKYSW